MRQMWKIYYSISGIGRGGGKSFSSFWVLSILEDWNSTSKLMSTKLKEILTKNGPYPTPLNPISSQAKADPGLALLCLQIKLWPKNKYTDFSDYKNSKLQNRRLLLFSKYHKFPNNIIFTTNFLDFLCLYNERSQSSDFPWKVWFIQIDNTTRFGLYRYQY